MPELVPAYLCHSDLGLMLYDCNRPGIYRGQHPLKLYEYAAAGLSILSTPHAEYQYIAPPVIQLRGVDEIASAIDLALAERGTWSSRARQFAEQYSWTVKFKQVESIIANLLGEVRTA
uniref:Glycosyltransferase family 1 protein n=1 Tax=Oscillatoriales cyanobacterium SpSt-402 TaxID=2282168 RepID=A0A832M2K2_9CYAN